MTRPTEDPVLLRLREKIRARVDPDFEFLSPGPIPWCEPSARVRETTVALVAVSGLHLKGDRPFKALEDPLGDTSYRIIPAGAEAADLDLAAPYVDRRHTSSDPEVALPLRALE